MFETISVMARLSQPHAGTAAILCDENNPDGFKREA
jgi:hypothetical protein